MRVTRIYESPRFTKPYSEEQWNRIEALGHQVDAELVAGDVRLTMGGEPTFVATDNMDGEEWNFTALGPEKARLADDLIRRLKRRFAPGGLLHYGQGKWYPGESLPRWAYSCYWRTDGEPVWRNEDLLARNSTEYGHTSGEARQFIALLAHVLGVTGDHIMPAYEDVWYYLWRERRLPTNVDPLASHLDDPAERRRRARLFERGLDQVVGYVLPLERRGAGRKDVLHLEPEERDGAAHLRHRGVQGHVEALFHAQLLLSVGDGLAHASGQPGVFADQRGDLLGLVLLGLLRLVLEREPGSNPKRYGIHARARS